MRLLETPANWAIALLSMATALVQGLFVWGLVSNHGVGIGVGFIGSVVLGLAMGREAPLTGRLLPPVIGTATASLWPAFRWLVNGDTDTATAFMAVLLVFFFLGAMCALYVFAGRRGWIVDNRTRQRNLFALLVIQLVVRAFWHPSPLVTRLVSIVMVVAFLANMLWPERKSPSKPQQRATA